jgi:hypothetical protein
MISLLVSLLILCLIASLVYYIIGLLPIPVQIKNVALIVFAIVVIYLLQLLLGVGPMNLGLHTLN